jgi:tRNA nucleotidyltransferase (CCA-adding enzyme)
MRRRDFTVNAMALPLTGPQAGLLVDPCGGHADLAARLVSVLHDRSFVDDATRILRAARYEARLGFRLEARTEELIGRDTSFIETISGARLRQEIALILREAEPERSLLRLADLRVLAEVHPALAFDDQRAEAFQRLRVLAPRARAAYWPLLAWGMSNGEASALAGRLSMTKAQSAGVSAVLRLRGLEGDLGTAEVRPSRVEKMLSGHPVAAILAMAAATRSRTVSERCLDYVQRWRSVRPLLDGDALLRLGAPRGAVIGRVLRRLRAARLDGEVKSLGEEEELARSLLSGGAPEAKGND